MDNDFEFLRTDSLGNKDSLCNGPTCIIRRGNFLNINDYVFCSCLHVYDAYCLHVNCMLKYACFKDTRVRSY